VGVLCQVLLWVLWCVWGLHRSLSVALSLTPFPWFSCVSSSGTLGFARYRCFASAVAVFVGSLRSSLGRTYEVGSSGSRVVYGLSWCGYGTDVVLVLLVSLCILLLCIVIRCCVPCIPCSIRLSFSVLCWCSLGWYCSLWVRSGNEHVCCLGYVLRVCRVLVLYVVGVLLWSWG